MEEGDRILLRLARERSITSWSSLTRLPGLYQSQTQATSEKGLLCYIRQYGGGGWFAELKTLLFKTNMFRNQPTPRCYKHHNIMIQRQQRRVGWLDDRKGSRKMSRDITEMLTHYNEAPLMVFCKAFLKHGMSITTHTHTGSKSTHIPLTSLVHANPSISD